MHDRHFFRDLTHLVLVGYFSFWSRIAALIQDVKDIFEFYQYLISWNDPLVTGGSLLLFLRMCLRFDLEYIGSLPIFILLLIMLYLAGKRSFGSVQAKYIQREIEKNRKVLMMWCFLV